MPEKKTIRRAQLARSPSAQASEYVREEIEHVREGKHGARSAKQVIAIGLSKARKAGVKLPPPPGKKAPKALLPPWRLRCRLRIRRFSSMTLTRMMHCEVAIGIARQAAAR